MRRYGLVDWLSWGLVTIGALNWGIKGSSDRNFVESLTGGPSAYERAVYLLVGLAGLWSIFRFFQVGMRQPMVHERLEEVKGRFTRAA